MFDLFQSYILKRSAINEQEIELIKSLSTKRMVSKGDFILREGEICSETIFITKGILKLSRIDVKGKEVILKFADENHWMSDRESYLTNKPSCFNIIAIEESAFIKWEKADFDFLLREISEFRALMKKLSSYSQIANQNRLYASIGFTAEEKYLQFTENHPSIAHRVPLHMLASHLGVTRETLSRIRRNIVRN